MKKQYRSRTSLEKFLKYLGWGISTTLLTLLLHWETAFMPTRIPIVQASLPQNLPTHTTLARSPLPNPPTQSPTIQQVQQGKQLYQTGQYTAAVTVWQEAASSFAAQGDTLNQAMVLSNLALAYQQLGEWSQAQDAIALSLTLLETQPQKTTADYKKVHAQALNNQGTLQLAQGDANAALITWKQATQLYQQLADDAGVSRSLINQAQALQALGIHPRACTTLLQVFGLTDKNCEELAQQEPKPLLDKLRQQTQATPLKLTGLNSLGSLLQILGHLNLSQAVLELSIDLQQPSVLGSTQLSLGNTARDFSQRQRDTYQQTQASADFEQARLYTQTALDAYQNAAQATSEPQIQAQLNRLSLLLDVEQWLQKIKAKKSQTANEWLPPGVSSTDEFSTTLNQWLSQIQAQLSQLNWTQLQTELTQRPPSYNTILAQTNFAQNLIRLKEISSRLSLTSTPSWETIDQLLNAANSNAEQLNNPGAKANALGYLGYRYEQTKDWSSAQQLTQDALKLSQSIQAWDSVYRWSWQLGRIYQHQGEIEKARFAYETTFDMLQTLRRDLSASAEDFQFTFREKVEEPVYRTFVDLLLNSQNPPQENLKQARRVMESLQIAELENFLQEPCSESSPEAIDRVIEEKDPTAAFLYPIILSNRLEIILKLPGDDNLYAYRSDVPEAELSKTLTGLRGNLQEVFVSQTLRNQSQQVYKWLIQPIRERLDKNNIKTLVFVLDGSLRNVPLAALYDGENYLFQKYALVVAPNLVMQNPKPLNKQKITVLAASLVQPPVGFEQFAELLNVEKELDKIAETGVALSTLREQEFTRVNFNQKLNKSAFQVIHIATHGKFSSDPDNTFILAADGKLTVKELDELFRLRNATHVDAIELLVFSACETADGDKRADLGIAGTTVRAGAGSAIATLWSVDDESSVEFMKQFYQNLAQPNVTKAEALRRAQEHLLQNTEYKSPRYWAPYILIGNWL
ncbi:CHAT domain-containing protein [Coleofasciculus sp.]|uniref:CHAT domain-containing protein n=1 Tax=Coleofasciculus sp. TaxID=3100458 RepID=UPI003A45FC19